MRLTPDPGEIRTLLDYQADMNDLARKAHQATSVEELRALVADMALLQSGYTLAVFGVAVQPQDPTEILKGPRP